MTVKSIFKTAVWGGVIGCGVSILIATSVCFSRPKSTGFIKNLVKMADVATVGKWIYSRPIDASRNYPFYTDTVAKDFILTKSVFEEEYTFKGSLHKRPNKDKSVRFAVIHLVARDKRPIVHEDIGRPVDFAKSGSSSLFLFLKSRRDGLFEPITGQIDADVSFLQLKRLP